MKITITLTPEQEQVITAPLLEQITKSEVTYTRKLAEAKRRADRRVENAKRDTADWKQRYSEMRKRFLGAQTEIAELKQYLRNGR
jgi:F0F1-type ATP synthase membrane subunit b/b'